MKLVKVTWELHEDTYRKLKVYAAACNVPLRHLISKLLWEDIQEIEKIFSFPPVKPSDHGTLFT